MSVGRSDNIVAKLSFGLFDVCLSGSSLYLCHISIIIDHTSSHSDPTKRFHTFKLELLEGGKYRYC